MTEASRAALRHVFEAYRAVHVRITVSAILRTARSLGARFRDGEAKAFVGELLGPPAHQLELPGTANAQKTCVKRAPRPRRAQSGTIARPAPIAARAPVVRASAHAHAARGVSLSLVGQERSSVPIRTELLGPEPPQKTSGPAPPQALPLIPLADAGRHTRDDDDFAASAPIRQQIAEMLGARRYTPPQRRPAPALQTRKDSA